MTEWYPVLLNLRGRLCVVAGGGTVAERKIRGLLEAGAMVRIVSPKLTEGLLEMAQSARVEWVNRGAVEGDIKGAALVFAATGDRGVNSRLASAARALGIPANVADEGESGDFIVPAVLRRGRLVLTASVSGAGPALASRLIREMGGRYGQEYAEYADMLGRIRKIVIAHVSDPKERRLLLLAATEDEALREWRSGDWTSDPQRLLARLRSRAEARQERDET